MLTWAGSVVKSGLDPIYNNACYSIMYPWESIHDDDNNACKLLPGLTYAKFMGVTTHSCSLSNPNIDDIRMLEEGGISPIYSGITWITGTIYEYCRGPTIPSYVRSKIENKPCILGLTTLHQQSGVDPSSVAKKEPGFYYKNGILCRELYNLVVLREEVTFFNGKFYATGPRVKDISHLFI